ncbi:gag-pol polyprotein [Tanacetum coccineum]
MCGKHRFYPWEEQSTLYPSLMTIPGDVGCTQSRSLMCLKFSKFTKRGLNLILERRSRPDIAHAVGVVSRYMAKPGRKHWEAVKRILRYIKGTSDVALCFGIEPFELKTPMEMWTGKPIEMEFQSNDSSEIVTRTEVNGDRCSSSSSKNPGGEPLTLSKSTDYPEIVILKVAMQDENWSIKRNGDGQVERYRTRLVVKGYAQKEGIDFNEIFSPVVRMTTIRVVLAMCAMYDLHLEQLDVKTAFLHENLEEEIYMLQPEVVLAVKKRGGVFESPYASAKGKFKVRDDLYKDQTLHMQGSSESVTWRKLGRGHWKDVVRGSLDTSKTVSWVSKLQSVVAMSTTESEYVTAARASKKAVWLKMLLEELGHKQEKITLFCDNQSALYLARNPAFHSKTKHIRVQYHFAREKVEEGTVDMQKIHTDDNVKRKQHESARKDNGVKIDLASIRSSSRRLLIYVASRKVGF